MNQFLVLVRWSSSYICKLFNKASLSYARLTHKHSQYLERFSSSTELFEEFFIKKVFNKFKRKKSLSTGVISNREQRLVRSTKANQQKVHITMKYAAVFNGFQ